jgi:hypothetical protein
MSDRAFITAAGFLGFACVVVIVALGATVAVLTAK